MIPNKFIVCVRSLIYNHSKYINDCLRGFMVQEVEFPVVFMLEDDASTDDTQEILREFVTENFNIDDKSVAKVIDFEGATTIFAQHKTNKNFYVAYIQMKYNHYSKRLRRDEYENEWISNAQYIAMCEGDDYWIDPYKLQKQVDFLESHQDFSMCFHAAEVLNETTSTVTTACDNVEEKEYFTNDVFPGWLVPTASIVYRVDMVKKFPILKHSEWFKYGDIVMILKCMQMGRVWGMKEKMSVYRMTNEGAVLRQRYEMDYKERMCKHYEALMLNFPLLDKQWPNKYIATSYYTRFRQKNSIMDMLSSLCIAFKHSPKYVIKKLFRIKTDGTY